MAKRDRRPMPVADDAVLGRILGAEGPHLDLLNFLGDDWQFDKDHFWGDALDVRYHAGINSGSGSAAPAINSNGEGGEMILDAGTADDGYSGFAIDLNWRGDQGALFVARFKINVATTVKFEMGWTDLETNVGVANVLDTPTAVATDGAVIIGDIDDTANIQVFGVKAGTLAGKSEPGLAFDTDYHTYALALADDDAIAFIDGIEYGRITNALEGGNPISPTLFVQNRDAIQHTLTCDWIRFGQRVG